MENTITYLSGATTAHIATSGEVTIHTVEIPVTTVNTITFRSTAATPVTYFVLPASTIAGSYLLDGVCGNGLDVVTAAGDVLIVNSNQ